MLKHTEVEFKALFNRFSKIGILSAAACEIFRLGIVYFISVVEEQVKPRYREALEEPLVDLAYALAATVSYSDQKLHFEPVQQALEKLKTQKLDATIYKFCLLYTSPSPRD